MPIDEEAAQLEVRTIGEPKQKKHSLEQILLWIADAFIILAVLVMIARVVAQSEVDKAPLNKKQIDATHRIALEIFDLNTWRIQQIAREQVAEVAHKVVDQRLADEREFRIAQEKDRHVVKERE